jgi:hypothetical protein
MGGAPSRPNATRLAARGRLTRSEEIAARLAGLCLQRQIAFAGAACSRARHVFAVCHNSTPVTTFDNALAALWDGLRRDDLPAIAAIYRPLTDVPESNCDDTLDSDWMAWLALATFEFPASLISTRLPLQAMAQCSALMLTMMAEIDLRLGWSGAPRGGRLATAEWAAQERCFAILAAEPSETEIPVDELVAVGAELGRAIADLAADLAEATGWRLRLPAE